MSFLKRKLLLIIDVQQDFLAHGALEIPNSNSIIAPINQLIRSFVRSGYLVWATVDCHSPQHISFASTFHKKPFSKLDGQMLWPDHCVRHSEGQKLAAELLVSKISRTFPKGTKRTVESYSAIADENDKLLSLYFAIKKYHVADIYIVGLALDYCVIRTISDVLRYFPTIKITCDVACTRMVNQSTFEFNHLIEQYRDRVFFCNLPLGHYKMPNSNINNSKIRLETKNKKNAPRQKKQCFLIKMLLAAKLRQIIYWIMMAVVVGMVVAIVIITCCHN